MKKEIIDRRLRLGIMVLICSMAVNTQGLTISIAGITEKMRVRDDTGKEWVVNDWVEGTRPYPKDLKEREAWYRQKWGESWAGRRYKVWKSNFIMSPGHWKWEEVCVIPNGKSACPFYKKSHYFPWIRSQALIYAPFGEEVSDIYVAAKFGIYHIDPNSKALRYIGWMPPSKREPIEGKGNAYIYDGVPPVNLSKDGLDNNVGMQSARTGGGRWMTVDPVTGRVYFLQGVGQMRDGMLSGPYVLRYVEKLLPFKVGEEIMLLPAFLDGKELYKEVGAMPVVEAGKRSKARFAVRTTAVKCIDLPSLMSAHVGKKILLSPDGKVTYVQLSRGKGDFSGVHAVDIDTGKDLGTVQRPAEFPSDVSYDRHAGICSRYDGWIYACKHTGSTGGPGKLFRFMAGSGELQMLYDSSATWENEAKRPKGYMALRALLNAPNDGPADAATLKFETTCFQAQCPRTGAIYNGGWDASGIRRYHDGFVTSFAQTMQMGGEGGRPEWGKDPVAAFGSLQSCPDVAPNGDVYLTSRHEYIMFKGDKLREEGIRVIRLYRTDWPKEQPINGYANRFLTPKDRKRLMIEYAKRHISNYKELSKVY